MHREPHPPDNLRQHAAAQARETSVSLAEVEKYLTGVDFPMDKDGLIEQAITQDAPQDVLDLMSRFPEWEYGTPHDIEKGYDEACS